MRKLMILLTMCAAFAQSIEEKRQALKEENRAITEQIEKHRETIKLKERAQASAAEEAKAIADLRQRRHDNATTIARYDLELRASGATNQAANVVAFDNPSVRIVNGVAHFRQSSAWTEFWGEVLFEHGDGLVIRPHRFEEQKTGAKISRTLRDGSVRTTDETDSVLVADDPIFIRNCRISDGEKRRFSGRTIYRGMPTKETMTVDGATLPVYDYGVPEKAGVMISSKVVYETNRPAARPVAAAPITTQPEPPRENPFNRPFRYENRPFATPNLQYKSFP